MQPNMVVAVTGHASFDKAAHLFGMDIKHVKVDPEVCSKIQAKLGKYSTFRKMFFRLKKWIWQQWHEL